MRRTLRIFICFMIATMVASHFTVTPAHAGTGGKPFKLTLSMIDANIEGVDIDVFKGANPDGKKYLPNRTQVRLTLSCPASIPVLRDQTAVYAEMKIQGIVSVTSDWSPIGATGNQAVWITTDLKKYEPIIVHSIQIGLHNQNGLACAADKSWG